VPGKVKLALTVVASGIAVYLVAQASPAPLRYQLAVPFLKDVLIPLGVVGFVAFGILVIAGTSNAVNLTDGLDGLAIGPVIMASAVFGLIAYVVGNSILTNYLYLHHVPRSGELAVLLAALVGAGLGFLWFNAPPAAIFMGDTGSLALGGMLGSIAVATKHEIVLAIVGGLFVLEAASVIIQVASFKLTGKRVFKMAPIHHHFEHLGWKEAQIVIRFWILSVMLALIGLSSLKIR
jgi:phospho-N-acetylmuramoyl-pentapeptide-transferase